MLPILQVGPLAIQLPGLLLLAGVWVGSALIEWEAPKRGLSGATLGSLVFYGLVAGLLGARLGYALRYWPVYAEDPLGMVSLNPLTLSTAEGVAAALLVGVVLARRRRLPLWSTLDAFTPGLAVFIAVRRFALRPTFPGFLFLAWLAMTAASRLFLEAFRGDSVIVLGSLRAAQLVSLVVLGGALLGLHQRARIAQDAEGVKGGSGEGFGRSGAGA